MVVYHSNGDQLGSLGLRSLTIRVKAKQPGRTEAHAAVLIGPPLMGLSF